MNKKQIFINRVKKEMQHQIYFGNMLPVTSKCLWVLIYGYEYLLTKVAEEDIIKKDLIFNKISRLVEICNLCK